VDGIIADDLGYAALRCIRTMSDCAKRATSPFLRTPFLRHRRFSFGWPFAAWDGTPGYQPYPDQTGYGAPSELAAPVYPTLGYSPMGSLGYPAAGSARTSVYVIPFRPGCDSQSQKLLWRDGGERSITIVRC
jgi:hypothetical protein